MKLADRPIEDADASDIRLKMWLAARDLVGCGPITTRLRAATMGLASLREEEFPDDVRQRALRLREKLTVQYRLLEGKSVHITDAVGEELASESPGGILNRSQSLFRHGPHPGYRGVSYHVIIVQRLVGPKHDRLCSSLETSFQNKAQATAGFFLRRMARRAPA
jgi:hypothetical protein